MISHRIHHSDFEILCRVTPFCVSQHGADGTIQNDKGLVPYLVATTEKVAELLVGAQGALKRALAKSGARHTTAVRINQVLQQAILEKQAALPEIGMPALPVRGNMCQEVCQEVPGRRKGGLVCTCVCVCACACICMALLLWMLFHLHLHRRRGRLLCRLDSCLNSLADLACVSIFSSFSCRKPEMQPHQQHGQHEIPPSLQHAKDLQQDLSQR